MQEIFIALVLFFDVGSGQLIGAVTAATDSLPSCEALVSSAVQRANEDLQTYAEGGCVATPLIVTQ